MRSYGLFTCCPRRLFTSHGWCLGKRECLEEPMPMGYVVYSRVLLFFFSVEKVELISFISVEFHGISIIVLCDTRCVCVILKLVYLCSSSDYLVYVSTGVLEEQRSCVIGRYICVIVSIASGIQRCY